MKGIIIKRILSLLLIIILGGCKTTQLPEVSTKLEPVFKEHKKIYKKQNVWKHVQWEYKYGRKVIDSIFTKYNLHDSDELYIRSEEHTSELQSRPHLVCRLLLEK